MGGLGARFAAPSRGPDIVEGGGSALRCRFEPPRVETCETGLTC